VSRVRVSIALIAWLPGCAAGTGPPVAEDPVRAVQPAWQQQMDLARRLTAAGSNYTFVTPDGVYTFYNDPRPFCYTYAIPGEWTSASEPDLYVSKHGGGLVGVMFLLAADLDGIEGASLVERAANAATRAYEAQRGRPVAGVELAPFESERSGTWRWSVAPAVEGATSLEFPAKIFVDLGHDAVAQITVGGTGDDDELARRILATLRTTTDADCYWSLLEDMLKAALGDG